MIVSFNHKGLQELFCNGKTKKLPQERLGKIQKILMVINSATELRDLQVPAFRLHRLKKPPYEGFLSIDVSGNFRIIFEFNEGKASNLNYLDTH